MDVHGAGLEWKLADEPCDSRHRTFGMTRGMAGALQSGFQVAVLLLNSPKNNGITGFLHEVPQCHWWKTTNVDQDGLPCIETVLRAENEI